MAKKRKPKGKKAIIVKENLEIEPTNEEIFVLNVWNLMDKNPLLKRMPKPTQEYLENFLKGLPPLKTLNAVELREHVLNMAAMSFLRDLLWSDIALAQDKHPKDWISFVDDKMVRLLKDVIKEEEKFMPKIFKEAGASGELIQRGKMIVRRLREESIEFTPGEDDLIIEGKAEDVKESKKGDG